MLGFTLRGYFSQLLLSHCALAENIQQLSAFYLFIHFFYYHSANSAVPQQSDSTSLSSAEPFGKSSTHWDTRGDLFWFFCFVGAGGLESSCRWGFPCRQHERWRHTGMLMRPGIARNCMTRSPDGTWRQNVRSSSRWTYVTWRELRHRHSLLLQPWTSVTVE